MISFFVLSLLIPLSLAGKDCVWILGRVQCEHDPTKNLNVEVRVWDRDSFGPFKLIDPDDLMGVTFTNEDGRFQLDGCGDDFDWIPGLNNKPEPYVEIRHYCNNDEGEVITMPEFKVFVPDTYDIGTIILDRPKEGKDVAVNKTMEGRNDLKMC
ncbi:Transthyretin-like family protein [Ancylostoma ceylanicum]|uniref:Transthyretin-like family protein n=1 Tax=Ancylostoma ceylanicum TaxID=53326 RepID=A0A0D6LYL5_9BILA|nr:Transthyretin-like family protein [Ancylostoma ceylanicum]